jgi:hypothetical protein
MIATLAVVLKLMGSSRKVAECESSTCITWLGLDVAAGKLLEELLLLIR